MLILIFAAVIVFLINKNTKTLVFIIGGLIMFRIILFALKDKFGFHRRIRNYIFDYYSNRTSFIKVHKNDKEYARQVEEMKNAT